jgi:hypothetical protein
MSENEIMRKTPVSVVRYGIGKEIQLFDDELVITGTEEDEELRVRLNSIKRLILMPGDPNPSKLILMADMEDDSTVILAEGMTNAKGFRAMLPHLQERHPELQLDPPDMGEQLRQALNTRRAWLLTCYGAIVFVCVALFLLYLLIAYLGMRHL